ncbi:hypothetical protein GBF38_007692 [Nibea albiflora]|uniref:Uncharacterized protein n=1 Tax=Nibea albiflora TaxID=240163 RepID=A0ACB7ENP7_NIBAL|nr:hypothetical protein GBF38_007692 [Nibea albiflora]
MNPFISMVDLVDMMATNTYADVAVQIMNYFNSKHLVESDDSFSDRGMDSSYCSLRMAGASSIPENFSAEQANIESNGDGDTDGEDYRSEDEHTDMDRSSDTDSCIGEDSLSGYDANCSADEDIIHPSSMRCSDSLPFTNEDNIVPVYGYPSERNSLSYEESGAAPTSAQIYEVTDSTTTIPTTPYELQERDILFSSNTCFQELRNSPTGNGTESGESTARDWKWFSLMDEAIGGRPSIRPPCLIALAWGENPPVSASASPDSVPPEPEPKCQGEDSESEGPAPPPKRQRRDPILELLERQDKRAEEREKREEEREERLLNILEKIVERM